MSSARVCVLPWSERNSGFPRTCHSDKPGEFHESPIGRLLSALRWCSTKVSAELRWCKEHNNRISMTSTPKLWFSAQVELERTASCGALSPSLHCRRKSTRITLPIDFFLLTGGFCLNTALTMPLFRYQLIRTTVWREDPNKRLNGTVARASRQISRLRVTAAVV